MAAAWPRTVVGDNNLSVQISSLRRVLDQDCSRGSGIQTIPGCGYRFVAPVKRVEADAHSAIPTISHDGEPSPPRLSIVVLPFANLSNVLAQGTDRHFRRRLATFARAGLSKRRTSLYPPRQQPGCGRAPWNSTNSKNSSARG